MDFLSVVWTLITLKPADLESPAEISAQYLEKLLKISQGMTTYTDLDSVLGYLLSAIHEIFSLDCGVLTIEGDRAYRLRSHRGLPASFVRQMSIPIGEGILGKAMASGKGLVMSRDQFLRELEVEEAMRDLSWTAVLILPVILQSQNLGLFITGSSQENFFDEDKVDALRPYLQILSVGMRNAGLIEMMDGFNRRLSAEVISTTQELTQTNARLIRRVRELKALYEITQSASESTDLLNDIFQSVAEKITDFFNMEYVGFLVKTTGKRPELALRFPSFGLPREVEDSILIPILGDSEPGPVLKTSLEALQCA